MKLPIRYHGDPYHCATGDWSQSWGDWNTADIKIIANQPDTLQKMTNSLLVNVDIPIDTLKD